MLLRSLQFMRRERNLMNLKFLHSLTTG
jgi:hypothetical protein